jgi:hypothetical protein
MAISRQNGCRDLLVMALEHLAIPFPKLRIAELGNQRFKDDRKSRLHLTSAKYLLEFFGPTVTSFDINGKDESISCDLSKRLTDQLPASTLQPFDLVTDFGTLEHITRRQLMAFANTHDLTKKGGLMVHHLPKLGHCGRHGRYHYSLDWIQRLAAANRYRVLLLREFDKHTVDRDTPPGTEVFVQAILQKRQRRRFNSRGLASPRKRWEADK